MTFADFRRDPLIAIANHKHLLLAAFLITFLGSATGYWLLEDYTFIQCLEWSAQSITSTGYGDLPAKTDPGRLWATGTMLWGVPVMLSLVTAYFVDAFRKDEHKFTDAEQKEMFAKLDSILEWQRAENDRRYQGIYYRDPMNDERPAF